MPPPEKPQEQLNHVEKATKELQSFNERAQEFAAEGINAVRNKVNQLAIAAERAHADVINATHDQITAFKTELNLLPKTLNALPPIARVEVPKTIEGILSYWQERTIPIANAASSKFGQTMEKYGISKGLEGVGKSLESAGNFFKDAWKWFQEKAGAGFLGSLAFFARMLGGTKGKEWADQIDTLRGFDQRKEDLMKALQKSFTVKLVEGATPEAQKIIDAEAIDLILLRYKEWPRKGEFTIADYMRYIADATSRNFATPVTISNIAAAAKEFNEAERKQVQASKPTATN